MSKQRPVEEGVKGREYESKIPHTLHATKDIHQPTHTAESSKHGGSRNGVKAKKKTKFKRSRVCTKGMSTTYLYPANIWEVSHGLRLSEGVIWWWREKEVYSRVPT